MGKRKRNQKQPEWNIQRIKYLQCNRWGCSNYFNCCHWIRNQSSISANASASVGVSVTVPTRTEGLLWLSHLLWLPLLGWDRGKGPLTAIKGMERLKKSCFTQPVRYGQHCWLFYYKRIFVNINLCFCMFVCMLKGCLQLLDLDV